MPIVPFPPSFLPYHFFNNPFPPPTTLQNTTAATQTPNKSPIHQQFLSINPMYSKYLDYTQAALRANHLAAAENDQKDIVISQMKSQVFELKRIELDYQKLNALIFELGEKYELLQQDKDRAEKEQRIKNDIDKNTILDLREEIDLLKVNLQKACLHIEELIRENTLKKRMNDARLAEVQQITLEIKGVDNKNQRTNEENRNLAITLKGLKEERKRLEEDCDGLNALLDSNIQKLKNLERAVRNSESINAKLDKTLHQAENDHQKLLAELKGKNEEAKRAENKLRGLNNQINEGKLTYGNVLAQSDKNKAEAGANAANLNNEVGRGKELAARIASVQGNIRNEQNQLDAIISQEEKLRKEHFLGLDDNKKLNGELDRLLSLINEYELINKELIDEIEIYSDQDQQAISILSRREQMKELITGTLRKLKVTEETIKHIKY